MAKDHAFLNRFMHATNRLAKVYGSADRSDADAPVVHRHDALEAESEYQLSRIEQHTDSAGHRYAEEKTEHGA